MLVFATFLTFKFWFHYFYILILSKVFGKHRLGSSTIGKFGKTAFTTECLTVANTQFECVYPHIFSQHIFKITPSRCQDPLTYLMEFLQKKKSVCLPAHPWQPLSMKGPTTKMFCHEPSHYSVTLIISTKNAFWLIILFMSSSQYISIQK